MGVNKSSITANKESNKSRKGYGAVSKKDNKKNMQKPSQHQVIQAKFLLQMVNQHQKWHRRQIHCQSLIMLIKN